MKLNETQITLLNKWLNDQADARERELIKNDPDLAAYTKIAGTVSQMSTPGFDRENLFNNIKNKKNNLTGRASVLRYLWPVAAAIALLLAVYTFLPQSEVKRYEVAYTEQQTVNLPDASEVRVNSGSVLSYDAKKWKKQRQVNLVGEAYFKVAKGQKFTVHTEMGEVAVLGTQFNVKQRAGIFQVTCFEGRVEVVLGTEKQVLSPGQYAEAVNGKLIKKSKTGTQPTWLNGQSQFENETLQEVVAELERQYNIKVYFGINVNLTETYTGGFIHNDLEAALRNICLPLQLNYTIENPQTVRINALP